MTCRLGERRLGEGLVDDRELLCMLLSLRGERPLLLGELRFTICELGLDLLEIQPGVCVCGELEESDRGSDRGECALTTGTHARLVRLVCVRRVCV